MRVDRSQSGEYASRKTNTHHASRITRARGVALYIFNDFGEHASRFTHHVSRIMRMWSRGLKLRLHLITGSALSF